MNRHFSFQFLILVFLVTIICSLNIYSQDIQSVGPIPKMRLGGKEHSVVKYLDNPASIAYGWSAWGSMLSMPIPAGTPFTILGSFDPPDFASSMVKGGNGTYYLTDISSILFEFNPNTGDVTQLGTITGTNGDQIMGITFNPANGQYYLISLTKFYSFDVGTYVSTLIGNMGVAGSFFIDLAFNAAGVCYAYDLVTDAAYTINPSTGVATLLGPLGYDANYGQGMSYDVETNTIYLSAFNNDTFTGQLRTMDPGTGATTLITDWGLEQIDAFALDTQWGPPIGPGFATNPNPAIGATGVSSPNVTLSWTNPLGATSNAVYFGTNPSSLSLIHSGSLISSIPLTGLNDNTRYYWRVDETDGSGTTVGYIWNFITAANSYGLVAYYPFNGNANDESGNGWNGTGTNLTLTQDRFGIANSAYYFNGSSSFIDFGLVPIPITNFSVSVWVNSSETNRGVVIQNSRNDTGFNLELFLVQNGTISFEVVHSYNNFNRVTMPIGNGTWHHIVALCYQDFIKLYLDGELQSTNTGVIGTQSNYSLIAGKDPAASDYFYRGSMDDIRVYNRTLSEAEILELYNEGDPISNTPVIFIPGIMGSPLYNDENNDNHLTDNNPEERIWIDYYKIKAIGPDLFLDVLQLDEFGIGPLDPSYNIEVAPLRNDPPNTLVFQYEGEDSHRLPLSKYRGFFNGLINSSNHYTIDNCDNLHNEGEDLFCFTYDWRKSISYNAALLNLFIDNVLTWTGSSKVNLIAHSLGGLVAKKYIQDFNSSTIKINNLIFNGTPHLGSPQILYTILRGDLLLQDLWENEFGFSHQEIIKISLNMPVVYHLFPTEKYFNIHLNNNWSTDKDLYRYCFTSDQGVELNYFQTQQYFADVQQINNWSYNQNLLDSAYYYQSNSLNVDFGNIDVYNIVGFDIPTIGKVIDNVRPLDGLHFTKPDRNLLGDGTCTIKKR